MRIPEDPFKNFDYENIKFKYYREWKDKNKESLEKEKFILESVLLMQEMNCCQTDSQIKRIL